MPVASNKPSIPLHPHQASWSKLSELMTTKQAAQLGVAGGALGVGLAFPPAAPAALGVLTSGILDPETLPAVAAGTGATAFIPGGGVGMAALRKVGERAVTGGAAAGIERGLETGRGQEAITTGIGLAVGQGFGDLAAMMFSRGALRRGADWVSQKVKGAPQEVAGGRLPPTSIPELAEAGQDNLEAMLKRTYERSEAVKKAAVAVAASEEAAVKKELAREATETARTLESHKWSSRDEILTAQKEAKASAKEAVLSKNQSKIAAAKAAEARTEEAIFLRPGNLDTWTTRIFNDPVKLRKLTQSVPPADLQGLVQDWMQHVFLKGDQVLMKSATLGGRSVQIPDTSSMLGRIDEFFATGNHKLLDATSQRWLTDFRKIIDRINPSEAAGRQLMEGLRKVFIFSSMRTGAAQRGAGGGAVAGLFSNALARLANPEVTEMIEIGAKGRNPLTRFFRDISGPVGAVAGSRLTRPEEQNPYRFRP
jgi:hypothetical protein